MLLEDPPSSILQRGRSGTVVVCKNPKRPANLYKINVKMRLVDVYETEEVRKIREISKKVLRR